MVQDRGTVSLHFEFSALYTVYFLNCTINTLQCLSTVLFINGPTYDFLFESFGVAGKILRKTA